MNRFDKKIGFIGGGNMAQAIIGGLVAQGISPTQIIVSEPNENVREKLLHQKVQLVNENINVIKEAEVIILAVKPQVVAEVLTPLAQEFLVQKDRLLISIVAGVSVELIRNMLQGHKNIIRVMPNTPALVKCGASGAYADTNISEEHHIIADYILSAVGTVVWVNQEDKIDAITAVSGSGPAYYFYMMEAMIQAGKDLGLDEETAKQLTLQTALGSATMAIDSLDNPTQLRKNVTSPNGTTQAALEMFEHYQVSQHIQLALQAAAKRSQELAQELMLHLQK